jgi:hypothetical protein
MPLSLPEMLVQNKQNNNNRLFALVMTVSWEHTTGNAAGRSSELADWLFTHAGSEPSDWPLTHEHWRGK